MGLGRAIRRVFGSSAPVVPVIRLHGVIGRTSGRRGRGLVLSELVQPIQRAFKTPGAKAVALLINSPGGSAVQSSLIAKRIRLMADEKKLPVLAFCEDVAASGGYWLALAADEVFADDSSIVGSIGVVFSGFGFVDAIGKLGIDRRLHTAGERKAILDPFGPEREEDVAHLLSVQRDIHAAFIDHVKARRGAKLKGDDADLFSGAFWAGRSALDLGLVDAIGEIRSVAQERFGEKVRLPVVNPPKRPSWLRFGTRHDPAERIGEWLGEAAAAVDDRAHWARFGL